MEGDYSVDMRVERTGITQVAADAVIVNLFEGVTHPGGATGALDRATGGMISRLIRAQGFRGKLGDTLTFFSRVEGNESREMVKVVVVGLGPAGEFGPEGVRRAAGKAIAAAGGPGVRTVASIVHGAGIGGLPPFECARALAEGTLLGAYRFTGYKSAPDPKDSPPPERFIVAELDASKVPEIECGVEQGVVTARAVNFARDLVNTPANRLTPSLLAEEAARMAKEGGLTCVTFGPSEIEAMGMGAITAVSAGSTAEPQLIRLEYRGDPSSEEWHMAWVGKGVTFDSGGLSLKTAEGMVSMKDDMAGAAAVLGAMRALGRLQPRINVLGVVPCVENMPSGTALRPGDVIRAYNGMTIEVLNTDAEGRLILADAVAYAAAQGAREIVDIATLTGSCVVALGHLYAGVVTNDDRLHERLMAASARTGERFWRLPNDPEYKKLFKSPIADLKNTGGRYGGAIIGGLIIGEFAGGLPWIHFDIAGTARREKAGDYEPSGATGFGVRTLVELAAMSAEPDSRS